MRASRRWGREPCCIISTCWLVHHIIACPGKWSLQLSVLPCSRWSHFAALPPPLQDQHQRSGSGVLLGAARWLTPGRLGLVSALHSCLLLRPIRQLAGPAAACSLLLCSLASQSCCLTACGDTVRFLPLLRNPLMQVPALHRRRACQARPAAEDGPALGGECWHRSQAWAHKHSSQQSCRGLHTLHGGRTCRCMGLKGHMPSPLIECTEWYAPSPPPPLLRRS